MQRDHNDTKWTTARESYTGSRLTDAQFHAAWNISSILNREIHRTGSFREKLTDFAHVFARSEKFDALRGEAIVRDIYKARFGESLNQTRECLVKKEQGLREAGVGIALPYARKIESLIKEQPMMRFFEAFDAAAIEMARTCGITDSGAKGMMKEAFQEAEGNDLYIHCKALECQFNGSVRQAERAVSEADRRSLRRTGPVR